jgi:hypothetical protein
MAGYLKSNLAVVRSQRSFQNPLASSLLCSVSCERSSTNIDRCCAAEVGPEEARSPHQRRTPRGEARARPSITCSTIVNQHQSEASAKPPDCTLTLPGINHVPYLLCAVCLIRRAFSALGILVCRFSRFSSLSAFFLSYQAAVEGEMRDRKLLFER